MEDFTDMATVDTAGYFGTNHRIKETHSKKFYELDNFEKIKKIITNDNNLFKIMQTIRTIDKEKNGFVTNQELEDILKLFYKKQLGKYDLKKALKPFASESNHLLINYTKFKEAVIGKNSSSITTIDL